KRGNGARDRSRQPQFRLPLRVRSAALELEKRGCRIELCLARRSLKIACVEPRPLQVVNGLGLRLLKHCELLAKGEDRLFLASIGDVRNITVLAQRTKIAKPLLVASYPLLL